MIKWLKKLFCRRQDNKYTFISIVYGVEPVITKSFDGEVSKKCKEKKVKTSKKGK